VERLSESGRRTDKILSALRSFIVCGTLSTPCLAFAGHAADDEPYGMPIPDIESSLIEVIRGEEVRLAEAEATPRRKTPASIGVDVEESSNRAVVVASNRHLEARSLDAMRSLERLE